MTKSAKTKNQKRRAESLIPGIRPEPTSKEILDAHRARREAAEHKSAKEKLTKELDALQGRMLALTDIKARSADLPPIKPFKPGRERPGDLRQATAVAMASDWHVGERVNPAIVCGLNEYSPEIAQRRSERFFAGIEWLIREQQSMFAVNDLVLWLGGDFLSGYIHGELVESNFMSPIQETRFAKSLIKNGIRFLLQHSQLRIRVLCNFGNHDRTTDKTRIGTAGANSYTWMMYHDLAEIFEDEERVQFQIADGHHLVTQVYDVRLHGHHGDSIRFGGGIWGVGAVLHKAQIQWAQKYDSDLSMIAHFHTYGSGERVVHNGSLIGYGAYSDWLPSAQPEPAQQAFFLIDSKRGKTQCAPIWVQDA